MQSPDRKNNAIPERSWRRMRDATRVNLDSNFSLNKLKESLDEVREKYRNAMVLIKQLRNEKNILEYQVDILKDVIEEMEERLLENQRENKINSMKHGTVPEDSNSCDITQVILNGVLAPAAQLAGDRGNDDNKNQKDQLKPKDRSVLQKNLQTAMDKMGDVEMKNSHLLKKLEKLKM